MKLNIISVTVVSDSHGCDSIILETDLPNGIYPFTGNQIVKMEIARGRYPEYLKEHFSEITPKIINV